MASEVEICNLALGHIRAGSINELTESSIQAQNCKLLYPILRDQTLIDVPWQFAHRVTPLAVLSDVEIFNWTYAYQYPTDSLQINQLLLDSSEVSTATSASEAYLYNLQVPNVNRQVEYKIYNDNNNRVIGANATLLRADYRAKITNTLMFDAQFIMALSHLLAAELAVPIIGGETGVALRGQSFSIYRTYVDAAIAANSNEQYAATTDSEFVTVRN